MWPLALAAVVIAAAMGAAAVWAAYWLCPVARSARSCTVPHVSALHSSTLDGMNTITDKLATVAAFALGALGLVIALLGFEEPSPAWAVLGLVLFVGAVWLWVRINPVTPAKHAADKPVDR